MKSVAAAVAAAAAAAARVIPFIFDIYNELSVLLEKKNIIISMDSQFFQESGSHL